MRMRNAGKCAAKHFLLPRSGISPYAEKARAGSEISFKAYRFKRGCQKRQHKKARRFHGAL